MDSIFKKRFNKEDLPDVILKKNQIDKYKNSLENYFKKNPELNDKVNIEERQTDDNQNKKIKNTRSLGFQSKKRQEKSFFLQNQEKKNLSNFFKIDLTSLIEEKEKLVKIQKYCKTVEVKETKDINTEMVFYSKKKMKSSKKNLNEKNKDLYVLTSENFENKEENSEEFEKKSKIEDNKRNRIENEEFENNQINCNVEENGRRVITNLQIREEKGTNQKDIQQKEKWKITMNEKKFNYLYMPYKAYPYQEESIYLLSDAIQSQKNTIMFESPTGTGKTQTILTSLFSYIKNPEIEKLKKHKILYFTRTVSQMNQVIEEAKKSAYNVRGSILSSRSNLCLNKKINNSKNNNFQIISECLESQKNETCPYKIDVRKPSITNPLFDHICDIEDLKQIGEEMKLCSYYFAKKYSDVSDLIVLSYSYLADSTYRESIRGFIEDNFIVFDEAHNIAKAFEQASSWELEYHDLDRVLTDIQFFSELAKTQRREGSVENSVNSLLHKLGIIVKKVKNNFNNLIEIEKKVEIYFEGNIIEKLFLLNELNTIKENWEFDRISEFIRENKIKSVVTKFLWIFKDCNKIFLEDREEFSAFKLYISKKKKINFICLNAKIGFRNIMNLNPKNILLASGTLSPFEILEKQLDWKFDMKFSIEPDLEKWQKKLAVIKVNNFFDFYEKKKICLNFQNRNDDDIIMGFLKFLDFLADHTPGGILIFLPSYSLLEDYKRVLKKNPNFQNTLQSKKSLFFEKKEPKFDKMFLQFKNCCSEKGGIFFLIFRGKYSEGLDFKNELARMVIIMGIPFSNLTDIKLKAKEIYLKEQNLNNSIDLKYQDWYINEAFIQINQAAGRIKRNENDYGTVLLIDHRFNHKKYDKFISAHLKKLEKKFEEKNEMQEFMKAFYGFNLKEDKKNKVVSFSQSKLFNKMFQKARKVELELEQEEKNYECSFCFFVSHNNYLFLVNFCDHIICLNCTQKISKDKLRCKICNSFYNSQFYKKFKPN